MTECAEKNVVYDLKHDEQRCEISPCHGCKLDRRKVNKQPVHGEQNGCQSEQREPGWKGEGRLQRNSHDSVADRLEHGGDDYKSQNLHRKMLSRGVTEDNSFRTATVRPHCQRASQCLINALTGEVKSARFSMSGYATYQALSDPLR
jgi:hypothetical protein